MTESKLTLYKRDEHHWDIYDSKDNRLYLIRGLPGALWIQADFGTHSVLHGFATVLGAMTFILDQSIHEIS